MSKFKCQMGACCTVDVRCPGAPPEGGPSVALFQDPLEHVVAQSPDPASVYLGSPSIARLPEGDLVVSHDLFGPSSPKDVYGRECRTRIFRSADEGAHWDCIAQIDGAFWSGLFVHREALYLLGSSAQYGDLVIRRSLDGGRSWTEPKDEESGLLWRGGPGREPPNYHTAPVPVLVHGGRIWRAFEDNETGRWPTGFRALVISAAEDADLLRSDSWTATPRLTYDPRWNPPGFSSQTGWLEGNVVADPEGALWNILRVNSTPEVNWAVRLRISPDGQELYGDPGSMFFRFPGGMSKFSIRSDPPSGLYWTLSNEVIHPRNPTQRNFLALFCSSDLWHWERCAVLLWKPEPPDRIGQESRIGFQYVDWLIEDEDLLFVSRTAYKGAHNFHDANYVTFHRMPNFRHR